MDLTLIVRIVLFCRVTGQLSKLVKTLDSLELCPVKQMQEISATWN